MSESILVKFNTDILISSAEITLTSKQIIYIKSHLLPNSLINELLISKVVCCFAQDILGKKFY